MLLGDVSIYGGVVIDVLGCVVKVDGLVIEGFYVIGVIIVLVMGNVYLGVGVSVGLLMVFGWIVVKYVVGFGN